MVKLGLLNNWTNFSMIICQETIGNRSKHIQLLATKRWLSSEAVFKWESNLQNGRMIWKEYILESVSVCLYKELMARHETTKGKADWFKLDNGTEQIFTPKKK